MRFVIFGFLVVILLCVTPVPAARAGYAGDLDGRSFDVEMTGEDGESPGTDVVRFDSGLFESDMFPPAEETLYTAGSTEDAMHFIVGPYAGESGTFEWTGSIRDHHVEGEVRCKTADGASIVYRFEGEEQP